MGNGTVKILLVEDNPGDVRLIKEMLAESKDITFAVDWVPRLSTGLEILALGEIDLVLLDLGLPDSHGLGTFVRAHAQAPQVPFVVLSGLNDETLALTAVREGAQDYLVKGQTYSGLLLRAIRYATERKKIEGDLHREIEERRAAEMAVEAERQRLYALLNGLPAFVSLIASDYSILFGNHVFEEIFGNWEGKRCYEIIFGKGEACENCPAIEVLENHTFSLKEMTVPRNGRVYNIYKYPFTDVDGTALVLSLGIDITKRKRAEEALEAERQRLYSLLDGLPGLVYLKAPDFSLKFANRLFRDICGDWEGKKCYEAIFKSDQPCTNCTQLRVIETGEPSVKEAAFVESNRTYEVYSYPFADVDGSPLVLTLGMDITTRKEAREKLQESEAKLRQLASQLMTAQEDERKRISRELHDELGQSLLVLKLQARAVEQSLGPNQQHLREECRDLLANFDMLVDNVRRLSRDLSPMVLEDLGLSAALQKLIAEFSKHYHIKCSLQETGIIYLFPLETQVAIYRIFQECLTNIGKHSQATELIVSVSQGYDHVSFIIQDNGRGFNQDQRRRRATDRGMGLTAMEERARMVGGILSIWSQEGRGTRIALEIPIPKTKR